MPRGGKPKPPGTAKHRNPVMHPWNHAEEVGWQHGKKPTAPQGLMPTSRKVWSSWFDAWWSSFWSLEDLGMLRQIITMYDQVERGDYSVVTKLTPLLHSYGITPKGRQDLRWAPPVGEADDTPTDISDELNKRREARRARLETGS